MKSRVDNNEEPDKHAAKRDLKRRKQHHLIDNRKSVTLLSQLSRRIRGK